MRRDVISAYIAAGARIASWVVVSAAVYRCLGAEAFAVVAFVKGTIGIVNYVSVGLAPAMIRLLAEARAPAENERAEADRFDSARRVYVNGIVLSIVACAIGSLVLAGYFWWVARSGRFPNTTEIASFALIFGIGVLIRLLSDAPSAVLQTSGNIALDNLLVVIAEVGWAIVSVAWILGIHLHHDTDLGRSVGQTYAIASICLLLARSIAARRNLPGSEASFFSLVHGPTLSRLLRFGSLTTASQLADYLYAPMDFLLIALLLAPIESATYAPAVQIDAGLLLLVTALAATLLPKSAAAHTSGNLHTLRMYYLRGTLASASILLLAAAVVWIASPLIFKIWFNDPMLATQAILPLVLVHTVVGGSSAVGRAILLGMNKVKPFTLAVLIAGVSNVILSFVFVRYLHLGLRGIVLGTICAVVGRCAVWMPWYVMRNLKSDD